MNNFTNVNIRSDKNTFTYLVDYKQNPVSYNLNEKKFGIKIDKLDNIYIIGETSNAIRDNNVWNYKSNEELDPTYIPKCFKTAQITLHFPRHSVDSYTPTKYAFEIYTFIRGNKVVLGDYIISRDELSAEYISDRGEQIYTESIKYEIIDPYYIEYGNNWADFKHDLCDELYVIKPGVKYVLNNDCPTLHYLLYPINKNDLGYIITEGYDEGSNSLNIDRSEYLSLNIYPEFNLGDTVKIIGDFEYNKEFGTLVRYIMETYNIWKYMFIDDINFKGEITLNGKDVIPMYIGRPRAICHCPNIIEEIINSIYIGQSGICICPDIKLRDVCEIVLPKTEEITQIGTEVFFNKYLLIGTEPTQTDSDIPDIYDSRMYRANMNYEVVIGDNDNNIYKLIGPKCFCDELIIFDTKEICFDNWVGFKEGMYIGCLVHVSDDFGHEIIIKSNKIPLTQDMFKYFVGCDKDNVYNIDFDKNSIKDMKIYNINTVNKIINNVIESTKCEGNCSKSNIIQPVFFKTRDIANLVLHPNVTENICINLDSFKSKVDTFIVNIGGMNFTEIGRTPSGVIFKITGNKLNKNNINGTYYILNEDFEVVTSGKYTYEY